MNKQRNKLQRDRDQAELAVAAAKQRLPIWMTLVRAVSRRPDLKVKLTGGPCCTDGETVFLNVPLSMADVEHDRARCGLWDDANERFYCQGCNLEVEADVNIFHECGHLLCGTFTEGMPSKDTVRITAEAVGIGIVDASVKAQYPIGGKGPTLHRLAKVASHDAWAFPTFNMVEDAYVNSDLVHQRPGLRFMFDASYRAIFRDDREAFDGKERKPWQEQPEQLQALVLWYCNASSLTGMEEFFSPEVVEQVRLSLVLSRTAQDILSYGTVEERWHAAMEVLIELRRIWGQAEKPPENPLSELSSDSGEPGDEGQQGEEGEGEGESGDPKEGDTPSSGASEGEGEPGEGDETGEGEPGEGEPTSGADGGAQGDEEGDGGGNLTDAENGAQGDAGGEEEGGDVDGGGNPTDADAAGDGGESEPSHKDGNDDATKKVDHSASGPELGATGSSMNYDTEHSTVEMSDEALEKLATLTGHDNFGDEFGQSVENKRRSEGDTYTDSAVSDLLSLDGLIAGSHPGIQHLTLGSSSRVVLGKGHADRYRMPLGVRTAASQALRLALTANAKRGVHRNLTSGRTVDPRTMGYRIPGSDDRIFARRTKPTKRDWTVLIGIDCSGSTISGEIEIERAIAIGVGDLLTEHGIPFSVYGHTGSRLDTIFELIVAPIKEVNDLWQDRRDVLASLAGGGNNLDGHTMEVYRNLLMRQRGTDRLLLYFTDGAMPAANKTDELPVLQQQLRLMQRDPRFHVVGVGIGTDSPREHGLDTIQVDGLADIPELIFGIGERLAR